MNYITDGTYFTKAKIVDDKLWTLRFKRNGFIMTDINKLDEVSESYIKCIINII